MQFATSEPLRFIILSTHIRKYGHVFITWFIHSVYAKV